MHRTRPLRTSPLSAHLDRPLRALAVAAALGCAPACEAAPEPSSPVAQRGAALAIDDLDPDDPGPTGPSLEPVPSADEPKTHAELLAEAMAEVGFTPSDPSTWSATKRTEICQLWANAVARQHGTALAFEPALEACLTGKPADLGMLAYQTLEMRRAGFMPSNPKGWSETYRAEVCEIPFKQYFVSLQGAMTTALASKFAKGVYLWCESYGALSLDYLLEWEPPTGWDYATWEFANWRRQGLVNWGEPTDDGSDLGELPK